MALVNILQRAEGCRERGFREERESVESWMHRARREDDFYLDGPYIRFLKPGTHVAHSRTAPEMSRREHGIAQGRHSCTILDTRVASAKATFMSHIEGNQGSVSRTNTQVLGTWISQRVFLGNSEHGNCRNRINRLLRP